jgi:hypothetical protein
MSWKDVHGRDEIIADPALKTGAVTVRVVDDDASGGEPGLDAGDLGTGDTREQRAASGA